MADQLTRNKAILTPESDPTHDYTHIEYCILERLGRARYHGEFSHGKLSLQSFLHSILFYHHKKNLAQNQLIRSQVYFVNSLTQQQNRSCCLQQLTRFYNLRKSKYRYMAEECVRVLQQSPDYQMPFRQLRQILGRHYSIKKLLYQNDYQHLFKSVVSLFNGLLACWLRLVSS